MPASENYLRYASLLYFKTFEVELPKQNYKQQDVEYIISELSKNPEIDVFRSIVVH